MTLIRFVIADMLGVTAVRNGVTMKLFGSNKMGMASVNSDHITYYFGMEITPSALKCKYKHLTPQVLS